MTQIKELEKAKKRLDTEIEQLRAKMLGE